MLGIYKYTNSDGGEKMRTREEWIKKILLFILGCLLFVSIVFLLKAYREGHFSSVHNLRTYVKGFGVFAPAVLIMIQALQVVVPVLPGFLGSIVGTGLFGGWISFWCNYIGISIGSIIAFLLAKWLGNNLVRLLFPEEKYQKYVNWINQKRCYTRLLFWSILLPLAPDDFLCYFSGLSGMSTKKFVWIIILAKPWCLIFYSILFEYQI